VIPEERKIKDILFLTCESLKVAEIEDADKEAEFLVAHYAGCTPAELRLDGDRRLDEEQFRDLSYALRRRYRHEPAQYIVGEQEFYGHRFKVGPGVLIPRPETEALVDELLKYFEADPKNKRAPLILDLCTGSGALAVTLAKEIPWARLIATDISKAAIKTAEENAAILGVEEAIEFLVGDLFDAIKDFKPGATLVKESELPGKTLDGAFDFVVSNPPYVSTSEFKGLAMEIKDYEPEEALVAGEDGLKYIKKIINGAPEYLRPGAMLLFEIGFGQAPAVKMLFKDSGRYGKVKVKKDLSGIERVVSARLK
jgi:release factor glutamine methyltransferase